MLGLAAAGAASLGPSDGYDGVAHLRYAEILDAQRRLPTEVESYEFTSPPGYHALAAALHRVSGEWKAAQALSLLWAAGLVLVAWLLARELFPGRPELAALAAAFTAALPIVPRLGVMFHPEMQHAFLASAALLLCVRASRRGWPTWDGVAAGVVLGLAAWTRPTAAAVAVALAAAVALVGRRRALRFGAAALGALLLVAGPWWTRQTLEYGNPLESNLDRYILTDGQPRSFWLSAPVRDLVLHPYRPAFAGELWPQFQADLWSDWFGGQHDYWSGEEGPPERLTASSQSVLGLLATPVAIGGLVLLARRRDFAGTAFALLVAVSWVAFVVQLVRFPQEGGDPIKSSYMLYLAPVWALAGVAGGAALWERGHRLPVLAWCGAYALSYAGFLLTSWP